jgi:hypothetical protein
MPSLGPNPIRSHIQKMVEMGYIITKKCSKCGHLEPLGPASYELIAVGTGLKYPTLINILRRPRISYTTKMILLKEGYIDYDTSRAYDKWLLDNGIPPEGRGRYQRKRNKKIACNPTEHRQPSEGGEVAPPKAGNVF